MTTYNRYALWAPLVAVLMSVATSSEATPLPNLKSAVIGTFLNKGPTTVEVNIISKDRSDISIFTLSSGQVERALLTAGRMKVYTPSESMSSRRLLFAATTPEPATSSEYFEERTRTFYFRIAAGRLILVKRSDLTAQERKVLIAFKRQLQRDGSYNSGLRGR